MYLNVKIVLSHDGWSFINGFAGTVKNSSKHVLRDGGPEDVTSEFASRFLSIDTRCTFEDLNNGFGASDLENLSGPVTAVGQLQVDNLGELGELDIVENNKGPVDT